MGCEFLEAVYQECLEREFRKQDIPFIAQREWVIHYKGERLSQVYVPDFVCFDRILIEIKTVKNLGSEHHAQIHNYLKATGFELGFLVNFGHYPKVELERIAKTKTL